MTDSNHWQLKLNSDQCTLVPHKKKANAPKYSPVWEHFQDIVDLPKNQDLPELYSRVKGKRVCEPLFCKNSGCEMVSIRFMSFISFPPND